MTKISRHWTAGTVIAGNQLLRPGTVSVDGDGYIAHVRPGTVRGAHQLGDVLLAPGAIDLHSDTIEKLAEPRPGVRLPFAVAARALDRRLAAAGITTGYAALSLAGDEIGLRERSATEALAHQLRTLANPLIQHRLHLRIELTDDNSVTAGEELLANGNVALLSVMNHTPGQGQFTTTNSYLSFYRRNYTTNEPDLHTRIRAKLAATPHLEHRLTRLSTAARRAAVPLAWHDPDSAHTINHAKTHGAVIAEFPTTIQAARAAGPAGLAVAMGAPNLLLKRSTSGNLSAADALTHACLDLLVSDYYPEALWPAALNAGLPLPQAVALLTSTPAHAARLTDRGQLAPGQRADLVAIDPTGTILRTIVAGRIVA